MTNPPEGVEITFSGHPQIRADDPRLLEVLDADEWAQHPAAIGFRAQYDPQRLLALRGRVQVQLETGSLQDRFEASIASTFHRGLPLLFRRDTLLRTRPLAWQSSKSAADLDRELITALRSPGAVGRITLTPCIEASLPAGTLVLVGTPIGNQGDLSPRAAEILASVDVIYAEDTRVAEDQLRWRGIRTRLVSCHEHNERARATEILERLAAGERVALISDAGLPLVSDPGYSVVRAAVRAGVHVEAIPGPSAVLLSVILSGLPTSTFRFAGFAPRKPTERDRFVAKLMASEDAGVVFEAAHRIVPFLQSCAAAAPDREIVVCRDLTKRTEAILRGTAANVAEQLAEQEDVRGEYTVVTAPRPESSPPGTSQTDGTVEAFAECLLQLGCPPSPVVRALQRICGWNRNQAYKWVHDRTTQSEPDSD